MLMLISCFKYKFLTKSSRRLKMKWQLITLIIVSLLIISGIAITQFTMAQPKIKTSCGNCNGKCTAENNCRQESCSALKTGTCNCGK
jgi:hypothetical protein